MPASVQGDVYLAEDTKLDRKVALKVLPPHLAENEERRARFQREAKALAALHHPNIVHVFSVEEAEGNHFITMQLVQGKTLTELIPTRGFVVNEFFEVAIPLADAVAAAHQEGITHRDLKPDNVMVSDDGRVTVLDCGLAKPMPGFATEGSELETQAKTAEGVIVGTVHYMSPEQAKGKAVDARSDIFSIGIVLYEMLTGRRPFEGENAAEVLASIIKDEPRLIVDTHPEVPRELSKMVQRCLAKEPTRRLQSALDIRNELEDVKQDLASGKLRGVAAGPWGASVNKWLAAASVVLLVLIGVLALFFDGRAPVDMVPRLMNPVQVSSAVGVEDYPTWSTDGLRLAYESDQSGNWDIWVTQLGGGEPVNLTADHRGEDRRPSWSPDGRQIAFLSRSNETWGLYVLCALGGNPRRVLSLHSDSSGAPQWSADGTEIAILVRDGAENYAEIVTVQTQETRQTPFPQHEGNRCIELAWSPHGRAFAYVDAVALSADATQLWVLPSSGGEPIPVTDGRTKARNPTWSADGRRLFFVSNRGGTMELWQQQIGEIGAPVGEPVPITAGLGIRTAAFSPDGTKLAYSQGRLVSNVWRAPIRKDQPAAWADAEQIYSHRSGNRDIWVMAADGGPARQLTSRSAEDLMPRWSPDGPEIGFLSRRSGNRDIWVVSAEGGEPRQVTFDPAQDDGLHWSPDGKWFVFHSWRTGNPRLYRIAAAGGGEAERLSEGPGLGTRWAPDGAVLYFAGTQERAGNLWALSLEDGREYPATDLVGRRGTLGWSLATDGVFLYFTWRDDLGDIWVMDVVQGE